MRAAIEKIPDNEPGSDKDPFVAGQRYILALYDRAGTPSSCGGAFPEELFAHVELSSTWPRLLGGCSRSFERRRNFCTRCFYEGPRTTGEEIRATLMM